MTVTANSVHTDWMAADGSNTSWPFSFRVSPDSNLVVDIRDSEGAFTSSSAVSATVASDYGSGTVTYPTSGPALAAGNSIRVRRSTQPLQTSEIGNQGAFFPETHEKAFDKLTLVQQEHSEKIGRSLRVPIGEASVTTLPIADSRANKALVFDGAGNPSVSVDNYVDQLADVLTARSQAEAARDLAQTAAADAAEDEALAAASATAASGFANDAAGSASQAESLVSDATAGFTGWPTEGAIDLGIFDNATTYFDRDLGVF